MSQTIKIATTKSYDIVTTISSKTLEILLEQLYDCGNAKRILFLYLKSLYATIVKQGKLLQNLCVIFSQ